MINNNIFQGLITALITPFKDNRLDFLSLERLLEYQVEGGVEALVLGGSTGEGTSLTNEEYSSILKAGVGIIKKRINLIAGCSSNSTEFALNIAQIAESAGVDGLMCTVPNYIKPTQEGLYKHFKTIHDGTRLPIMLYSVPSRTVADFTDDTILRLAELDRILALKDADRDMERPLRISIESKKGFNLLSGNDEVCLAYNAQGGVGCVSVASNIAPKLCKLLQENWKKGNVKAALKIHQQLLPLYKALFAEQNPIPVKYAAEYLGLCSNELRLPLVNASSETMVRIERVIDSFKDIL